MSFHGLINQGKYVFTQFTELLPQRVFGRIVAKLNDNKYVKHFDFTTQIPSFVHFSEADVHDVNAMDHLVYEPSVYYIFDRAYVDFDRLYSTTEHRAFFVVRGKSNLKSDRMCSQEANGSTGVRTDQIGKPGGFYFSKNYPRKIRRTKFHDAEKDRIFVFLINNFYLRITVQAALAGRTF